MLAGYARRHRLGHAADFWTLDSPGNAGFHGVEFSPRGHAGCRRRGYFPGDASFDPCAREFTGRLRRCVQPERFTPRLVLVAGGIRFDSYLFRIHLATL